MSVVVEIDRKQTRGEVGQSLFECAEQMQVPIPTSCLKNGKCRECLVEITEGAECLSPLAPQEKHLKGAFRLSCRARIAADTGRIAAHTLRREAMRIDQRGDNLPVAFDRIPLEPAVTREGDKILLEGRQIARGREIYGLALDIGTTTVVVRLVDLQQGTLVAASAFENPQRFAGTNVMSRILYNSMNKGRLQQRTLIGYLTHALEAFPVDPAHIYEMVVVGNTTMRDLFFGLDVEGIGEKPFRSITETRWRLGELKTTAIVSTGKRLRLPIHDKARVVGLPVLGCHVGADAAACLLAVDLPSRSKPFLLMDIGTNTEIVCATANRLLVASCPAGPAFEGGAVSCGMPGLDGAIENITLSADGDVRYEVIGGAAAEGICGSGLVDVLDQLMRLGRITPTGRLTDGEERFYVDRARDIYLSEADISELAQAKGASSAGVRILLEQAGVAVEELDTLFLAGGFARYLDPAAARHIGLIPDIADENIRKIGNAALEGATIALCSVPRRQLLMQWVESAEHLELAQHPHFFDYYVEGCQFR